MADANLKEREQRYQCECGSAIFVGDQYHPGDDVSLCLRCAPDWSDIKTHPENFLNNDLELLTQAEADRLIEAHLAAGGSLADKLVVVAS